MVPGKVLFSASMRLLCSSGEWRCLVLCSYCQSFSVANRQVRWELTYKPDIQTSWNTFYLISTGEMPGWYQRRTIRSGSSSCFRVLIRPHLLRGRKRADCFRILRSRAARLPDTWDYSDGASQVNQLGDSRDRRSGGDHSERTGPFQ